MSTKRKTGSRLLLAALVVMLLVRGANGATLYVDRLAGSDANSGTQEQPFRTLAKAAERVNGRTEAGPITIKIASGVYALSASVEFNSPLAFTEEDRLTIEAAVLPDDPRWKPALMPIILSTEDPRSPGRRDALTSTYSIKVKESHVTIRGLKFLGNPLLRNWHCCVERVGPKLDDLLVTQCMFVGNKEAANVYCAALATGDRFVVDHCVFYGCHAATVFWDGTEGIPGKGNAMRYCIVDGGHISGVWTCQTASDFEFHHNIITRCNFFWMRKRIADPKVYEVRDCVVAGNEQYSGYGVEMGPTGPTGAEVTYREENVEKTGSVVLEKDKTTRNYLHVMEGTLGSELKAGLFCRP